MIPIRPINLFAQAVMGIFGGILFGTIQFMVIDAPEPQRIAVVILIVLAYCYLVKTLLTSLFRGEYYEPYEHTTALSCMALAHWIIYSIVLS